MNEDLRCIKDSNMVKYKDELSRLVTFSAKTCNG